MQSALVKLAHNRTTIVIAHRLSTIIHADKILYLQDGVVLESGTHNKLIKDNGEYLNCLIYNLILIFISKFCINSSYVSLIFFIFVYFIRKVNIFLLMFFCLQLQSQIIIDNNAPYNTPVYLVDNVLLGGGVVALVIIHIKESLSNWMV